jgi:hypothetical protein
LCRRANQFAMKVAVSDALWLREQSAIALVAVSGG